MSKKLNLFLDNFKISNNQNILTDLIKELGLDKCFEILNNLKTLIGEDDLKIDPHQFSQFALYEFSLSTLLFSLLRREENSVKAFLSNLNSDIKIQIVSKEGTFTKRKFYFKFPYQHNKFLFVRTNVYKFGKVNYYDAIKTLDFGDINLLFMHLSLIDIKKFSNNKNIIEDLDRSRKLRNYVYHHNLLFSLGKEELKKEIMIVIKNLPDNQTKQFFIDRINNVKNKHEYLNLNDDMLIKINKEDYQFIF